MHLKACITLIVSILFSVSVIFFPSLLRAGSKPKLNDGDKWRIGYYEGGPYSDYTDTMRTLIIGLIELGWIESSSLPDLPPETAKPFWQWLTKCNSPFLSFKEQDSYSAQWDGKRRLTIQKTLLSRLKQGELDLIFAMGTWAGKDLANNGHSIPTMVLSTSDPIKAGIIKSADNSGYDHVTARLDPNRYIRQIRMFHRIVGFETLGVAFEDTPDGRIYSSVSDIQQVAKERCFKVHFCKVLDTTSDTVESDRSCLNCYQQLLRQQVDAVYVTALTCVDRRVNDLAEIFKSAGVPSFSMVGSKYVQKGIMMSISSDSGYVELGRYNAWKFGEILNGQKPGKLKMIFEDPLDIAVNIETITRINFDMPESIMSIAAEIYDE